MNKPHDNKATLVLINRKSRRGDARKIGDVLEALREGGVKSLEYYLEASDKPGEIIEKYYTQIDAVVIGGGDGTLHWAAGSLVKHGLPVGILPLGTANDLARTLGIPADPREAVSVILKRHSKPVNLGIVNGRYFFNVANIGLGVKVARRLSGQVKRKLGIFGYGKSLLDVFRRQRPFRVAVEYDNRRLELKSIQVAVGNGKFYGGGIAISDDADIGDNSLVLYSLEPKNLWQIAVMGPLFKLGKIKGVNGVTLLRSDTFRITTARTMTVSADGEIVAETPADFAFLRNAVNIYVPET